jgi:chromosome segregation ATPase
MTEAVRLARRNDQYLDVISQQRRELKLLRDRLLLEHSKTEFFVSIKEGQARKHLKQLHELHQQVIHSNQLSDSTRREKDQAEADREMFAKANHQLHDAIDDWQHAVAIAATEASQLLSENTALKTEIDTLKEFLKIKDAECAELKREIEMRKESSNETWKGIDRMHEQMELLKQQLSESENRARFFESELQDVGMENVKLRADNAKLREKVVLASRIGQACLSQIDDVRTLLRTPTVHAKRSHPAFPENRKRPVFAHPANVISPQRLKRAKAIVGAALEAEINEF